jgi:hypothetical protein
MTEWLQSVSDTWWFEPVIAILYVSLMGSALVLFAWYGGKDK